MGCDYEDAMKNLKYRLLAIFILTAVLARADMGGAVRWPDSQLLGPTDLASENESYEFAYCDDIELVTQDTTVELVYPNRLVFTTDYSFNMMRKRQPVIVAFMPDVGFKWPKDPKRAAASFKVAVQGKELDPTEIKGPCEVKSRSIIATYFDLPEDPPEQAFQAFIFPIDFGPPGICNIRVEYSYNVDGTWGRPRTQGGWTGFYYTLAPAQYWAGNVIRIKFRILFEGVNRSNFCHIFPPDFKFTPSGVQWEWDNFPDGFVPRGLNRSSYWVGVSVGVPVTLGVDITTVLVDGGAAIRTGPGPTYDAITTIRRGEEIYVYQVDSNNIFADDKASDSRWVRCRTFDNVEGYICAVSKGVFLLDTAAVDENKLFGGERPKELHFYK